MIYLGGLEFSSVDKPDGLYNRPVAKSFFGSPLSHLLWSNNIISAPHPRLTAGHARGHVSRCHDDVAQPLSLGHGVAGKPLNKMAIFQPCFRPLEGSRHTMDWNRDYGMTSTVFAKWFQSPFDVSSKSNGPLSANCELTEQGTFFCWEWSDMDGRMVATCWEQAD